MAELEASPAGARLGPLRFGIYPIGIQFVISELTTSDASRFCNLLNCIPIVFQLYSNCTACSVRIADPLCLVVDSP